MYCNTVYASMFIKERKFFIIKKIIPLIRLVYILKSVKEPSYVNFVIFEVFQTFSVWGPILAYQNQQN